MKKHASHHHFPKTGRDAAVSSGDLKEQRKLLKSARAAGVPVTEVHNYVSQNINKYYSGSKCFAKDASKGSSHYQFTVPDYLRPLDNLSKRL